jgi:hypothetical protein
MGIVQPGTLTKLHGNRMGDRDLAETYSGGVAVAHSEITRSIRTVQNYLLTIFANHFEFGQFQSFVDDCQEFQDVSQQLLRNSLTSRVYGNFACCARKYPGFGPRKLPHICFIFEFGYNLSTRKSRKFSKVSHGNLRVWV